MGARVAAGPACSVVVDRQSMYWLAGKVRCFRLLAVHPLTPAHAVEEHGRRLGWAAVLELPVPTGHPVGHRARRPLQGRALVLTRNSGHAK
jgi:hypothetical protein